LSQWEKGKDALNEWGGGKKKKLRVRKRNSTIPITKNDFLVRREEAFSLNVTCLKKNKGLLHWKGG